MNIELDQSFIGQLVEKFIDAFMAKVIDRIQPNKLLSGIEARKMYAAFQSTFGTFGIWKGNYLRSVCQGGNSTKFQYKHPQKAMEKLIANETIY